MASCTAPMRVGSWTGCALASQISVAARCSVSTTWWVIARAGAASLDVSSSPITAVFPATHSTRPTSLESATAPAAAPVGGYGVPENCWRRSAISALTSACASGELSPRTCASARRATAAIAAASRRRRLSCHGAGHTSTQAATEKAAASVHPRSRGPMAEAGCATETGRTNVKRAAVEAVAAGGATTPAKSTTKPTRAMATTAATLWVETSVPSAMKQLPAT